MDEKEIVWTRHFEERLLERFGITLNDDLRESIEEQIKNKEPFTTLEKNFSGKELDGVVYQVEIENEKVMMLTTTPEIKVFMFITALRKSWFHKGRKGDYYFLTDGTKPRKNKKVRLKKNKRTLRLQYKLKKDKMLLKSNHETCLI